MADEKDLLKNLLPFWIENYFTHPSYLKVESSPSSSFTARSSSSMTWAVSRSAANAIELMRQACREAGFAGLHVLGENRGTRAEHLEAHEATGARLYLRLLLVRAEKPTPAAGHRRTDAPCRASQLGDLPQVVTVSQAWSGWHDEGSIWKIPPAEFNALLHGPGRSSAKLPSRQLGSRMLLLGQLERMGRRALHRPVSGVRLRLPGCRAPGLHRSK